MDCFICYEVMTGPIYQCQTGHSLCDGCTNRLTTKTCPMCQKPIGNIRNYQLEELIGTLSTEGKLPCHFTKDGCKFNLTKAEKHQHEIECRYRKFLCEGRLFAKWPCKWVGSYKELEKHFQTEHKKQLQYKIEKKLDISFQCTSYDCQIISYYNGQQFFWYKQKIDAEQQKIFWLFQLIGTQKQAQHFYYEFEIYKGPINKFKISEVCTNDVTDAETLFKQEKCVVISFNKAKQFLENGKLPIKFRVMSAKKHNEASK